MRKMSLCRVLSGRGLEGNHACAVVSSRQAGTGTIVVFLWAEREHTAGPHSTTADMCFIEHDACNTEIDF